MATVSPLLIVCLWCFQQKAQPGLTLSSLWTEALWSCPEAHPHVSRINRSRKRPSSWVFYTRTLIAFKPTAGFQGRGLSSASLRLVASLAMHLFPAWVEKGSRCPHLCAKWCLPRPVLGMIAADAANLSVMELGGPGAQLLPPPTACPDGRC